jgi:hypothetical protein
MGVTITPLGFRKPDRNGDNEIAANAQKAQEILAAALSAQAALEGRVGQAEANIRGGLGDGPGLTEDPLNPGTYFMADTSPIQEDPTYTGLYNF